MGAIIGVLAAVLIIILVILWIIWMQKRLIKANEQCGNAMSQIGVQQATRWDVLSALADLTTDYSGQECRMLTETIAARKKVGAKTSVAEAQQQEDMLAQVFTRINVLADAYPDLQNNSIFMHTVDTVRHFENNVRMSRIAFNDSVTQYNRLVTFFPGSLAAALLRFNVREFLRDDREKTDSRQAAPLEIRPIEID